MNLAENVAPSFYGETLIEPDFYILKFNNDTEQHQYFKREISASYIQFHFCTKGNAAFAFNNGNYMISLKEESSLLLYNPQQSLPVNLTLEPNSWVLSILVPITRFHSFFSTEANYITFLSEENKDRKYYKEAIITPSMAIVLNQLMNHNIHPSVKQLYFKAKAFELISLYFNRPENMDIEQCPFLADEDNVAKIKRAKEIVISRIAEPPTLKELAEEINLPINRLKEGFRQVYGEPVFTFLINYKLELARQILATGSHNVNEVGLKVGYSTASHFISAFKKKFGTTPKKYIMSLNL